MTDRVARNALIVIAVIAAAAALYWLRAILAPLMLAAFLVIMIDGVARGVRRYLRFLPDAAALPLAVGLILVAFGVSVALTIQGFAGFRDDLGGLHVRADQIIADVGRAVGRTDLPNLDQMLGKLDPTKYVGTLASTVQNIGGDAFFVLIYLGFLLASRSSFRKKIVALFPTHQARKEAGQVFERIRDGVEGYVWVQTVTGLMIAAAAFVVMEALHLKNAGFWTFVIVISGYIPIIGGAVAGVAPPLFALIQFQTYWQAIVLFVALQVVLFVVGNIVLPRMQARSMNLDPVAVLLGLAFWGALWGLTGAFLSTPLTVMVMAVLAEFKGSRWVAILLSGDGKPYPVEPPEEPIPGVEARPKRIRRKAPAAR